MREEISEIGYYRTKKGEWFNLASFIHISYALPPKVTHIQCKPINGIEQQYNKNMHMFISQKK